MSKERVYQIILIAGFLLLFVGAAMYVVSSRRQTVMYSTLIAGLAALLLCGIANYRLIAVFFSRRSSRYGLNTVLMITAFTSIAVIIQALSARHDVTYDLTRNKRFTLAEQTTAVLDSLHKDIDVYAFFKRGTPDEAGARDLLGRFALRTQRFRYEFVDPDQNPLKAKEMGVDAYGTAVVVAGEISDAVDRLAEETLLNAVVKVTRETAKVVYFVKGHGEKDPSSDKPSGYSIATEAMEKERYVVRTLSLFDEMFVPDDCDVLVVAGPKRDYLASETGKIEEYLGRGGNAIVLVEPRTVLSNIEDLLAKYRIKVNDDAVVDPFSRVFGGEYSVPVVTEYEDHVVTRGFDLATFFPTARSLAVADGDVDGISAQYLAKTGKTAWGETDLLLIDKGQAVKSEEDNPGPLPLIVLAEKKVENRAPGDVQKNNTKIIVVGDSDFADNSSFRLSGNSDLFLNLINYLGEEEELIAVRPKKGLGDRLFLTASQGRFIFLVCVVLLPLAVIGFGTTVWVQRRRRG